MPRRKWTIFPRSAAELGSFSHAVTNAADIDGDGVPDGIARMDTNTDSRLRVFLSKRSVTTGGAPVVPFVSPATTTSATDLAYFAYHEEEPTVAARAFVDMDGDGLPDAVATDRITPKAAPSQTGHYGTPASNEPYFINQTRLSFVPGMGGRFDCDVAKDARCTISNATPLNYFTSPLPEYPLDYRPTPGAPLPNPGDPGYVTPNPNGWLGGGRIFPDERIFLGQVQIRPDEQGAQDEFRTPVFADVNGDGFTDVVLVHLDWIAPAYRFAVYLNDGGARLRRFCPQDPSGTTCNDATDPGIAVAAGTLDDQIRVLAADVDASGADDIVIVTQNKMHAVAFSARRRPGLLTKIENGLGASTSFKYESYQAHAKRLATDRGAAEVDDADKLESRMHVAYEVETSNGLLGMAQHHAVEQYRYRRPAYDSLKKAFRGFGEVTTIHPGGESTRSLYLYGPCEARDSSGCTGSSDRDPRSIHQGSLLSSTTFGGDPDAMGTTKQVLAQTSYRYEDQCKTTLEAHRHVCDRFTTRVTTRLIDGSAKAAIASRPAVTWIGVEPSMPPQSGTDVTWSGNQDKLLVQEYDFDANANLTASRDFGEVASDNPIQERDEVIRRSAIYSLVAEGVWAPTETSTTGNPGSPVRRAMLYYDARGNTISARAELSGTAALQRFHPLGQLAAPPAGASSSGWVTLRSSSYDSVGNIVASYGPLVQTAGGTRWVSSVRSEYDPTYAHSLVSSTVDLDGVFSPANKTLTTSYVVDRGFGSILTTISPEGARSEMKYDAFGRVIAVHDPLPEIPAFASSNPRVSLAYEQRVGLSRTRTWVRRPEGAGVDYHESISFTDALGIPRLELSEGEAPGTWTVSGAATRNARGQVLTTSAIAAPYTGSLVDPDVVFSADAVPVTTTYDAYGRATSRWEGAPSGVNVGTRELAVVSYSPLRTIALDANAIAAGGTSAVHTEVDGHGRVVSVQKTSTAHSSKMLYDYLPTGEAVRERRVSRFTGQSTVRERVFDTLGRMVSQTEPNTTANGRPMVYAYNDAGWLVGTSDSRGCGENIVYDAAGRVVYRDESPCTLEQPTYTPPAPLGPTFGNGTEAFFVYDAPEAGETADDYGALSALRGRLVAKYDLATHDRAKYDALGRAIGHARRVVSPGLPAIQLSARFTPNWFRQSVAYDSSSRVVRQTTGADLPELLPGGESAVTMTYNRLGGLAGLGSSYGTLIRSVTNRDDGRTSSVAYGDLAWTRADFTYHDTRVGRPVSRSTVWRDAPSLWSSVGYTPAGEPTQTEYISDTFRQYDDNQNPISIDDSGSPHTARNQTMQYDDLDRLTAVTYTYVSDDTWTDPLGHEGTRGAPRANIPRRTPTQSFEYDYLGNITHSTSNSGGLTNESFDRQLGEETHGTATNGPNQFRSGDGTTASYDSAGNLVDLMVERDGPCAGGACNQRYHYVWSPTGRLERAMRWDLGPGESPANPQILTTTPTWLVRYAYETGGQRVLKSVTNAALGEAHTLEVFGSLRLDDTKFVAGDYERTTETEKVDLAGVGIVEVLDHNVPDGTAGEARLYLRIPDAMGSSSIIIDQKTSEIVEHTTYDAFGTTDNDFRPSRWGNFRDKKRFTGKEEDIEVGLVYFGARYYHPNLRRWISPDPLTIHAWGADPNPYAYVSGQVFSMTDPWGLTGSEIQQPAPGDMPPCEHCQPDYGGPVYVPPGGGGGGGGGSNARAPGHDWRLFQGNALLTQATMAAVRTAAANPAMATVSPLISLVSHASTIPKPTYGSIRSFIQQAPALLSQAASLQRDYHKVAAFTVVFGSAVRVGHSPLEDPRLWAEQATGVKSSSGAMIPGVIAGHVATAVLEAPAETANLIRAGAQAAKRGGFWPVQQGALGVARAIEDLELAGRKRLGAEVTVETANGLTTRPDLYVELPNGQRAFLEVKTGAKAALNENQLEAFPQIWENGGTPIGDNAAAAGLTPGVPIGPTPVWTIHYPYPLPPRLP